MEKEQTEKERPPEFAHRILDFVLSSIGLKIINWVESWRCPTVKRSEQRPETR